MQLIKIKEIYNLANKFFSDCKVKTILQMLAVLSLASLTTYAFAVGVDLLSGTEENLVATISGSGKKYLYIAEGITGLIAGITTKNWAVLIGIIVVAVALNILLAMVAK